MLTENKIAVQKCYDEAIRFWDNAHKELQLANKNGYVYQDVKHLQIACGTAYLAVIKAIQGIFLLRNIPIPKRRASIEYYQKGLSSVDKKMLNSLNVAYHILHLDGYYGGLNDIRIMKIGFEEAKNIIGNLKKSI